MDKELSIQEEKRYYGFLTTIGTYVPLMGILAAIGFLVISIATNTWQLRAVSLCAVLGSIAYIFAFFIIKRNKNLLAAIIMTIAGVSLFPSYCLFLSGISIICIAGVWLASAVIANYSIPRTHRRNLILISSLVATFAIFLIELAQPAERLYVFELSLLQWLFPLIVVLGGALLLIVIIRGNVINRLITRLLLAFLIIVTIPVITIGVSSTIRSIESARSYAINILDTAINTRERELKDWITVTQSDVILETTSSQDLIYMRALLTSGEIEDRVLIHSQLISSFYQLVYQGDRLIEMFLMDSAGLVIADTLAAYEGTDYSSQEFFILGIGGLYMSSPFYFEQVGEYAIMISYPVLGEDGEVIGVLTGRAPMSNVSRIITATLGTQEDIHFYMVDSRYHLLSSTSSGQLPLAENPATNLGIADQQNGSLFYTNHNDVSVAGVYHWLSELNTLLVAEIPQSVAFRGINILIITSVGLALVSAIIASLGAFYIIRSLSSPLSNLSEAAKQVAAGNLNARASIEQEDEFGILASAFNNMTIQLQGLVTNLEERVEERTRELEKRSLELRTAAEVARDASMAKNTNELLNRAAFLIRERFGFYHVGFFLVDNNGEYAVMQAAGGEAGQRMLANKHKLKVGEVGIVGYVTKTGESRIALDTGADSIHFRNPFLPDTHSEMTLPLKIGNQIIGALDVQSDKLNAFSQNDVAIMQILSDQIAVAIQKTQLLQDVEQSIAEMEKAYQEYTTTTWRSYMQATQQPLGYRFEGIAPEPINDIPSESMDVIKQGKSVILPSKSNKNNHTLAIPIRLRGQTIGVLNLQIQSRDVPTETVTLVEEAAEHLALALENARLLTDAQLRAARERAVAEITARMRETLDLDSVLKTAAEEIRRALNLQEAEVRLGLPPNEEINISKGN